MADVRYFHGETRLGIIEEMPLAEFEAIFPGQTAIKWSQNMRVVGLPEGTVRVWDKATGKWSREGFLPAHRAIQRKSNPSNHECDPRCLNATGFQCECSCKGKNHGGGKFQCLAA